MFLINFFGYMLQCVIFFSLQELEQAMKTAGVQHPVLEKNDSTQLLSDVLKQTHLELDRYKNENNLHASPSPLQSSPVNGAMGGNITIDSSTIQIVQQSNGVVMNELGGAQVVSNEEFAMDDNFPVQGDPMMSVSSTIVQGVVQPGQAINNQSTLNLADVTDMDMLL